MSNCNVHPFLSENARTKAIYQPSPNEAIFPGGKEKKQEEEKSLLNRGEERREGGRL